MGLDYLIFGNVDSREYGVDVFFKDVDRTPKRIYRRIDIPGRNGEFLIDENRYEDVPVAYDCVTLIDADRKAFLNALAAQRGHIRLWDTFNADEFYEAVFEGDVDPNVTKDRENSTFTIRFTRKPQRFLISGETALSITSGAEITNPTLQEASPLLEVKGNGNIEFNGYDITLDAGAMGYTQIESPFQFEIPLSKQLTSSLFNATDDIQTGRISIRWGLNAINGYGGFSRIVLGHPVGSDPLPADVGDGTTSIETVFDTDKKQARVVTSFPTHLFSGDTTTNMTDIARCMVYGESAPEGGFVQVFRVTATITITYTPATQTLSVQVSGSLNYETTDAAFVADTSHCDSIYAYSTVNVLGNPTYIDCDLGEAYKIENDEYISLNSHIDLGSDLPKLASGVNEITYDNTITELKLTPRWWEV